MFTDSVKIIIGSGSGGAGAVSFRKEKFVVQGGPDGGDGGKGGDVYFVADKNTSTLSHFRGAKKFIAQSGNKGEGRNKSGKNGKDLHIKVPPGTQIIESNSGKILLDLLIDGQSEMVLKGGKGGMGNARFKSASNQRPIYAQKGIAGLTLEVNLELKLIADIALVGFPNAGKSSLIATITNSKPKIANYAFSTLIPNLGVASVGDGVMSHTFVIADIPGLIDGASSGRGLGLEFLRHIERTKIVLFMLDIGRGCRDCGDFDGLLDSEPLDSGLLDSNFIRSLDLKTALLKQLKILKNELEKYSQELARKPYAVAITKSDLLDYRAINHLSYFDDLDDLRFTSNFKGANTGLYISHKLLESMGLESLDAKESSADSLESKADSLRDSNFLESLNCSKLSLDSKNLGSKTLKLDSNPKLLSPLFILPISSANHINLSVLKNLLFQSLKILQGV